MKLKKIISIICVIAVLSTIIALPAAAQTSKFTKYIINDSFDSDLGNWIKGAADKSYEDFGLERVTMQDGTTALKLSKSSNTNLSGGLSSIAVNLLDEPLYFKSGNNIVIKTRFMQAGTGTEKDGARTIFKINRPDTTSQERGAANGSEIGHGWYTAFDVRTQWNSTNNVWDYNGLYNMKTQNWTPTDKLTDATVGKWYDVTLTFYGGEAYDIAVSVDGGSAIRSTGTISHGTATFKQYTYIPYTYYFYGADATAVTKFERFDSFSWLLPQFTNDLYVDSFQVYELRDFVTVSQAALEKTKIAVTDDIKLTLTSNGDIGSIPSDAVYIDGVEADFSYDSAAKTVTLNPVSDFTPGETVTVKVDSAKLADAEGIIYEGETEFTVNVSDIRLTYVTAAGYAIEGETVQVEAYGYESAKPESTHEYQWQMSATGEEGSFSDITGAAAAQFTVTAAEADKYLRVKMTPYGLNGEEREQGSVAYSNVIMPEFAPEISNIAFNMEVPYTGNELTVSYDFTDKNGDSEDKSATVVEWYTATGATDEGTLVHTGASYTPAEADFGKYVRCVITPYSDSEYKANGERTPSGVIGPVEYPPFVKYHINDEFDTSVGNWRLGVSNYTADDDTFRLGTGDFAGTLMFKTLGSKDGSTNTPRIITSLDKPVDLTTGSKVIVKTRFYNTGDGSGAGTATFKVNRPDVSEHIDSSSGANDIGMHMYTAFGTSSDNIEYGYGSNVSKSLVNGVTDLDLYNKWVEAEMIFDGEADADPESYTLRIKIGDKTYPEVSTTIKQCYASAYTVAGYTGGLFDTLKEFTWMLRVKPNTLYIDYFKVIEERAYANAEAALAEDYISTTDAIKVEFTSDTKIHEIPEGAVYIEGVDSDVTYDEATQTVTLQPKSELPPDTAYKVVLDDEKLETEGGIKYQGSTELAFATAKLSVNTLVAKGRVIPGTRIEASYKYASNLTEGTHLYQWQMSETGAEGTFTDIDGATSAYLDIPEGTSEIYGKYIRFKMIPYAADGTYGFEAYSDAVIPEKTPVASNVALSSSKLFSGIYISAVYDYSDENGDAEGDTVVKWYSSDNGTSGWTQVHEGSAYLIEDTDNGKYFRCEVIPVAVSAVETTGAVATSAAEGPVADMLSSTNLYTNPSFETGDLSGYYTAVPGSEVVSVDAHTGEYSFHLPPRTGVNQGWGQKFNVTTDNVYVSACYAKKTSPELQNILGFWPYSWSRTERADPTGRFSYTLNDNWQLVVGSFKATGDGETTVGPVSFEDMANCDAYVDDMYFGELLIADIETYDLDAVTVPRSGQVSVTVTSGKVLNQVGTQHGLWNETAEIVVPDVQGVSVDGNNIVVDNTAKAGKINVEIRCVPSYAGADQLVFQKFAELEILAHDDKTPKALNVDANGTVAAGVTVYGSYDFYQVDGEADNSTVRWMYSDTENGEYFDIPGATSYSYVVESQYAEKYLKFVVTPKSANGLTGAEVSSGFVTKARVPVASDVSVSGSFNVGDAVSAVYTYYDPNKDAEGTTTFKWYAADSANGAYTAISGATSDTFTLTEALTGKYIKVGVTPVSSEAPEAGAEVLSDAYAGPAAPVAKNVAITRDETRLVGNYDYYHIHSAREADTAFKWTVDGKVVSTAIDYVINFTGAKTVTFTVTPVAESNPARGASVSVSATVVGNSGVVGGNTPVGGIVGGGGGSSSGGGGGSSSGGGSTSGTDFTSGVTSVNNMNLELPESSTPAGDIKTSDIDGHWGKEYIEEMVSRGVMSADEGGNYNPDEIVTREEMLTYLFMSLALEATEYTDIFEDVADGEFADMLQTMVDNGTIAVDTHFRPADSISREEMCKILYVSLKNADKLEENEEMLIEAFEDFADISDWAKAYVNGIYSNKIMIGVSDTRFAPQENITRAQAATLLTRIIKLIEGEE